MARSMHLISDETFRVLVTTTTDWHNGEKPHVYTQALGPYSVISVAKGIMTQSLRQAWTNGNVTRTVECKIQRSVTEWEDW